MASKAMSNCTTVSTFLKSRPAQQAIQKNAKITIQKPTQQTIQEAIQKKEKRPITREAGEKQTIQQPMGDAGDMAPFVTASAVGPWATDLWPRKVAAG